MPPSTVLFCGLPAFGHLYPMIPLALAARAAGHQVVFATGAPFLGRLRSIGFETHRVGISIDEGVATLFGGRPAPRRPDGRPDDESAAALFLDVLARPMAADVTSLLDRVRPDLVVHEETAIGARVAAAARGIPAITHRIVAAGSTEAAGSPAGREIVGRLFSDFGAGAGGLRGDRVLDIFPDSLHSGTDAALVSRIPVRPVPWSEPGGSIPTWRGTVRRPVVYLTLGTIFAEPATLRAAMDAISAVDVEVLVALGPVDRVARGRAAVRAPGTLRRSGRGPVLGRRGCPSRRQRHHARRGRARPTAAGAAAGRRSVLQRRSGDVGWRRPDAGTGPGFRR